MSGHGEVLFDFGGATSENSLVILKDTQHSAVGAHF
jgi:hypothetical protein